MGKEESKGIELKWMCGLILENFLFYWIGFIWVVKPCSDVVGYQCFGGHCHPHLPPLSLKM
jgi:hypothetical protein